MPNESYAESMKKWELRTMAVTENLGDLPHLETYLGRLDALLGQARELTTRQALLTAQKQEVSKLLEEVILEGRKVMSFLDAGVRLQYGNRSEKLVAFGQQPFRSQPRVRLVGPDGRPLK